MNLNLLHSEVAFANSTKISLRNFFEYRFYDKIFWCVYGFTFTAAVDIYILPLTRSLPHIPKTTMVPLNPKRSEKS